MQRPGPGRDGKIGYKRPLMSLGPNDRSCAALLDLAGSQVLVPADPKRPFIGDTTVGWCYGIRAVQELLGHSDVKTSTVRIHVPNRGPSG